MPNTPATTPSTKGPKDSPNESNNPVTISIKGLNKADYHLIVYDERWIKHADMISLAHDMKLQGYHFSIIPVAEDPSKAIHVAGTNPVDPNTCLKGSHKLDIPKPEPSLRMSSIRYYPTTESIMKEIEEIPNREKGGQ